MKTRLALSLAVLVTALSTAVAAAGGPAAPEATGGEWKVTIPEADPRYVKYEQLWTDVRSVDTDISHLRHEIAFLQIMRELNLSKEQLEKLLPIAEKAQADAKFALNNVVRFMEVRHAATIRFWQDIAVEDLTPKKKTPTISGNFDKKIWDEGEMGHNYCAPDRDWKVDFDLKRTALEFEKLLTPEQLAKVRPESKVIGEQLTNLRGGLGNRAGTHERMVLPYWIIRTFEDTEVLGSWKKTVPDAAVRNPNARPILTGVLLEPHALNWIQRQLGVKETNDWAEEDAQARRAAVLLRYTRRSHYRQVVNANWTKGMVLTQQETGQMLELARQMCDLYMAETQAYLDKGHKLTAALAQERELVAAGKDVPADLTKIDAELGPQVGWMYGSGPICEYTAAEDNTFMPRSTGIWKMFPEKTAALVGQAEATLMESQRIVLWNAHGNCYKPWAVFVNPVLTGGPPVFRPEPAALLEWRGAGAEKLPALREALFAAHTKAAKKDAMAQAAFTTWLDSVRAMGDAEFQLAKYELDAVLSGCQTCYTGDTSGVGSPEQNGIWPKIDWSDPKHWGPYTIHGKLEARLEFMMMPDNMQFLHVRNELMKQYKPATPVDLDKLPTKAAAN